MFDDIFRQFLSLLFSVVKQDHNLCKSWVCFRCVNEDADADEKRLKLFFFETIASILKRLADWK